jgi:hypothetical protein
VTIFLHGINQLIFLMAKGGVLFEVRTDFLYIVQTHSGIKVSMTSPVNLDYTAWNEGMIG